MLFRSPAGVSLSALADMSAQRVLATGSGASINLAAVGSLTLQPATGAGALLTSGGAISLAADTIIWTGTNSAVGAVTALAKTGTLIVPGDTFSLTADNLSFTAATDLSVDGTFHVSGNVGFKSTSGSMSMAADLYARSGASIRTLEFEAGRNLSLLEGSFPNVTSKLSIIAGWELAQSLTLLNWAATGSSGELIVSTGGNLVLGEPELAQSTFKADYRISISSNGYTDDMGQQRGGNLAVVSVPTGWTTPRTRFLSLYAKYYLHLNESFTASENLSMRGGQAMITRRAILRNIAEIGRAHV